MTTPARYTPREELANVLTHGLGTALSIAALAVLVASAAMWGDVWRVVSFSIYGASLTLLYLFSTLYHGSTSPRRKRFFRLMDHAAIFLLIAGTYTPFTLVTLRGPWGWTLFGLTWGCAIVGVATTVFFLNSPRWLVASMYIAMGWLALVVVKPMFEALPVCGMALIGGGGLFYTGGVAFYVWQKLPFNHAIWHVFVLGGSVCHFLAVLLYVLPMEVASV